MWESGGVELKNNLCQNDPQIMPDTLKKTIIKMEVRINSYDNLENICANFVQLLVINEQKV